MSGGYRAPIAVQASRTGQLRLISFFSLNSSYRGVYCAAAVAYITGINTPELFENSAQWLIKCQTYEGGFGATPGNEAHGGYSFCALAALTLFGQAGQCDLKALLRWALMKQDPTKGGFAGRTNKLVDGCYSFWQGALIAIIDSLFTKESELRLDNNSKLFISLFCWKI